MKKVSKLSFIALAILLAGCNEKVSPELLDGKSSTPTSPSTPVAPEEYYFAVENSSDTLLNYKLHKTGAGNANAKCEVRSETKLSSDIFRGNPSANDITCYFDAEELSLYHSGFSVSIKASKNTCDFVGYMPYGYYNRIPGDSTGKYLNIVCGGDETTSARVQQYVTNVDPTLDITTAAGAMGCDDWASQDIVSGTRLKFTPENDEEMCRFNYDDGDNEQCDIGYINVNTTTITYIPPTDTEPEDFKREDSTRTIKCGGKVQNCIKGPTTDLKATAARFIENTRSELNKDFAKEYKYAGLTGTTASIIQFSNWRRNLASTNIDFESSTSPIYTSVWGINPTIGKTFEPRVMDHYSANLMLDGVTPLVSIARIASEGTRNNMWTARPLAADPFLGFDYVRDVDTDADGLIDTRVSSPGRVNPFYTFYCFDTAYDVKARIRMVVRDWDRVFPSNSDIEYLSDLFRASNARQDLPGVWELPGELDTPLIFNDRSDWDDRIPMDRTAGAFNPFITIWQPTPTGTYLDGWFNPNYFPEFKSGDE